MIEISNSDRDMAVRLLKFLSTTASGDKSLKAINARRLSLRLAKKLAAKQSFMSEKCLRGKRKQ